MMKFNSLKTSFERIKKWSQNKNNQDLIFGATKAYKYDHKTYSVLISFIVLVQIICVKYMSYMNGAKIEEKQKKTKKKINHTKSLSRINVCKESVVVSNSS